MALPGLRGDDLAIPDTLLIDPGSSALFNFKTHVAIAGQLSAFTQASSQENLNAMADRKNPFATPIKLAHQFDQLLIVAEEFRCASTHEENRLILVGANLREGKLALDKVPGLFHI